MSLLAGFDIVIEIMRAKLLQYIQTSSLAGQPLAPPTEIVQGSLTSTGLDLIVMENVDLTFAPDQRNWATIVIPFEDSTIAVDGTMLSPVKGSLFIAGVFNLVTANGSDPSAPIQVVQIAFSPNAVTHQFDEAVGYTAAALAALPSRAMFEQKMDIEFGLGLLGKSLPAGPPWMIDPSQNGTIGGRFCSLQLAPIDANSLGMFGIVLSRNIGLGDPATKSGSVIAQGQDLAVSLSPFAFHDIVFCPNQAGTQAAALANQPSQLAQYVAQTVPPDCGSAGRMLMSDGNWLTGISITFGDGVIHVFGGISHGKQGAYCFRVSGTFATDISFKAAGGSIQPSLNPNPPSTDVTLDVSWYCVLIWGVAALVGGAVSLFIVAVLATIGDVLFNILASSQKQQPKDESPIQVGFAGITFNQDPVITPEGLTLQGRLPTPAVPVHPGRTANLTIEATNPNQTTAGTGTYHYSGNAECKPKDFRYTELHEDQVMICTAQVTLMSHPRTFVWSIDDPPVRLTAPSGLATIKPDLLLPMPDGSLQTIGRYPVDISYTISDDGSSLTLTDSNHYLYALLIRFDCSDQSGATVSAWLDADVIGDAIQFGADYYNYVPACNLALRILISHLRTLPANVPRDGDPAGLTQSQVVQVFDSAIREGAVGTSAALAVASAQFGPGVRLAILRSLVASSGSSELSGVVNAPGENS